MAVVVLFLLHWQLSVFCQSFFLHRYGAHKQFTMSRGWEIFFNYLTAITQNSSYLNPRGYAILHRMHHAYSDTERDPHSPVKYRGPIPGLFAMMYRTKRIYHELAYFEKQPEARFDGDFPKSRFLEWMGKSWPMRFVWGAAFAVFYYFFATETWQWFLLPGHWIMGAVHGAIVNWAGHKYGYRNFATRDQSRNVLAWDLVTLGELFQNNHHRHAQSPNFAQRRFEWDPAYGFVRLLGAIGILDTHARPAAEKPAAPEPAPAAPPASSTPSVAESLPAI
jgi:stearoyl-CoA desaturase (delta-9 desaturase)